MGASCTSGCAHRFLHAAAMRQRGQGMKDSGVSDISARWRVVWEAHGRLDVQHRFLQAVAVGVVVHRVHEACRGKVYAGTLLCASRAQVPASSCAAVALNRSLVL
jgi:hypothetical protein